jgi:hypothetical protein
MAVISVSVSSPTTIEARAAAHHLSVVNYDRSQAGLATFANIARYLEHYIQNALLQQWIDSQGQSQEAADQLKARWLASTDAQRAAAIAQLAPPS